MTKRGRKSNKKKKLQRGKKITKKPKNKVVKFMDKIVEFLDKYWWIPCSVVTLFAINRSIYEKKMLSNKTTTVVAQITHVWIKYKKGWRCVEYKYNVRGKEYKRSETITREEYDYLNVGDCIEIKVSLVDNEVTRWNREKGKFKCP